LSGPGILRFAPNCTALLLLEGYDTRRTQFRPSDLSEGLFVGEKELDKESAIEVYNVYMERLTTAERILAAARGILDREGAAAVTMRSVARQVKITPMAIYRHFPDREGLLDALANQGFAELAAQLQQIALPKGWEAKLLRMSDVHLDHAMAHPHLFNLMFLTRRPGARRYPQDFQARRSPTASLLMDELGAGMKAGVLRRGKPWEIALHLGALSHGLITLYLGDRIGTSPQGFRELYRTAFRTYFHGLLA